MTTISAKTKDQVLTAVESPTVASGDKKQKHDITATKYYGVALTNTAKVVLAKFKK